MPSEINAAAPDPIIDTCKKDIDRTLLRENLRRTPDERLRALMDLQKFAEERRRAGAAVRLLDSK